MKRYFFVFGVILALGICVTPGSAINICASRAVLMDAASGRVLYAHNEHEMGLIASTTKLMTALIVAEHSSNLDEEVEIRPEWTGAEGSSIYLVPGEIVSVRGLLYGLLLQSGNDAAVSLACHVAGDVEAFAQLMNRKAQELGMKNSRFANPSGLNADGHYSTAYDMALLACACLENETVAQICACQCATFGNRTFYNHNKLLHRYKGCVGMKTGYTELAGRTLVSAAECSGQTLVCVTLDDADDWNDHEKLLDYGFLNYPTQILCRAGERFGSVSVAGSLIPVMPVVSAAGAEFPMGKGELLELTVERICELRSPVAVGTPVGRAVWTLNGEEVASVNLVCAGGAAVNTYEKGRLRNWLPFEKVI